MIDTHAHLTDPRLKDQLDAVMARAAAAGVTDVITIGCTPEDGLEALCLVQEWTGRHGVRLHFTAGIHPCYCKDFEPTDIDRLPALMAHPACVAMGEIGLDYFHPGAKKEHQAAILRCQLNLAKDLEKPVVIHCREAVTDIVPILAEFPSVACVFHCFTGTEVEASLIAAAGYHISFTGAVTYKNNQRLRDVVRDLPARRVMIETDCPYLSPEPLRSQKINEPALVQHVLATVAGARGLTIAEADTLTTANAIAFFRLQ